jgi:hypothetical protein
MKVTLSAAMRARDVSRPRPEDEAAAREGGSPRKAGNTGARPGPAESGDRAGSAKNAAGGGRRRKRR